ncbi:DUF481 domain-containing protein [Bacteriovorax sp. Seq25_V]|uniref:DUF481 domain-containing protein n=1 Tax=Bacteriovorax sp. Seq25_V TaxID=1201288 RepID=UPI00038A423E|nr:DUF481 domain-containing protein [Bacteriovorax sp. Seq25_V]EQC47376.1 PF04338 family protein [Bacteriovorax sp. Seq25_V]
MRFSLIAALVCLSMNTYAKFSSEDSVLINLTGGNTEQETYALKSINKYEVSSKQAFELLGNYNYGESEGKRSIENWLVGLRYDYSLTETNAMFLGQSMEADRFIDIKRRYNTDFGYKHHFVKTDNFSLLSELGYRYEIRKNTDETVADKKTSKVRAYVEANHKYDEKISYKFWAEYVSSFSESKDYLLNLEPSIIVNLTSILSMKSAYLWKYDNAPVEGKGKSDYNYTLTLIAKF